MHIVGGCYFEACDEPYWSQLYGSGGRAAAAVGHRVPSVRFTTYLPSSIQPLIRGIASTYRFEVDCIEAPDSITFYYHHSLADPTIRPRPRNIQQLVPISVTDEVVLRFGMLEGTAVVAGSRVIYDPQSAFDPRPFAENGSSADELAVVCNTLEAKRLTSMGRAEDAAVALIDAGASVVVVKMGSDGALVQTAGSTQRVPAFKTSRVWSLGSGDVFAAVFAAEWGVNRREPPEAAEQASRATAYYCESQTLPIPATNDLPAYDPIVRRSCKSGEVPQVYLAGPFFTAAERWLVAELRTLLAQQGLVVFSPLHDVGMGVAADVVQKDIDGIESSSVMLAILDGLDAGTLFEVGYARARDIPVVGFVQNETRDAMKMLEGTGCIVCDDLVTAIYQTVWAAPRE